MLENLHTVVGGGQHSHQTRATPTTGGWSPIRAGPYAYSANNPANLTDPTGMAPWDDWEVPEWVPVVGGSDCIRYVDDNCERNPKNQEGADFAGGVMNTVIPGQERRITRALGQEDKVDRCSGYYTAGEYAGYAVDAGLAVHGGVSAWRALNSGRGIGVGNFARVARHQAHRSMPELSGGAVRQANWLKTHHAFRTHWHTVWRGARRPGGM